MKAIALKPDADTVLDKTYSVHIGKPLPKFSDDLIKAFSVKANQNEYIGFLSHDKIPPRFRHLEKLSRSNMQIFMRPLAYFPVMMPGESCYRTLVISDKPQGVPLPLSKNGKALQYREDAIIDLFLKPYIRLLKDFQNRSIAYRNLRPDNIFYYQNKLTFGECFMLPAGYKQPASYEPLLGSMAAKDARGIGTISDDVFAGGMMVLSMAIGKDFSNPKNPQELQENRLILNSLTALMGEYRLSERLTELLKGTLSDSPRQRWSLDDIDNWAEGQKVPLRHHQPARKASRPFVFNKQRFLSILHLTNTLGMQASDNIKSTIDILTGKDMENWLARSNGDKKSFAAIKSGIAETRRVPSSIRNTIQPAFGLAGMCSEVPVYYNNEGFALDGIGIALAVRLHDTEQRKVPFELILSHLVEFVVGRHKIQGRMTSEMVGLQKLYEKIIPIVAKPYYGMGIERCVYELNRKLPCQSKLFDQHMVQSVNDILPALEDLAAIESNHKLMPIDRHIAAYVATHTNRLKDETLYNLNDENKAKAALAMIQILSLLESFNKQHNYPNLAKWVLKLAQPVIGIYQSKTRQEELKQRLKKIEKKASIQAIANIIDQPIELHTDGEDYLKAQKIYQRLQERLELLEEDQDNNLKHSKVAAYAYTPYISGGISGLLTLAMMAMR